MNKEHFNESTADSNIKIFVRYMSRSLIFIFIFLLFTVNLVALSVSLQCNKGKTLLVKIASGTFAFMFGILYLIINYYLFRIKENNDPCVICSKNIFGL